VEHQNKVERKNMDVSPLSIKQFRTRPHISFKLTQKVVCVSEGLFTPGNKMVDQITSGRR